MATDLVKALPNATFDKAYGEQEEIAINTTGVAYAAGADTVHTLRF